MTFSSACSRIAIIALSMLSTTACDKEPAPAKDAPSSASASTAHAMPANPHGPGGLASPHGADGATTPPPGAGASIEWTKPESWEQVENPSSMRIATFRIPKVEGDEQDGELSIMQAGGSVDDNINRWKTQFKELATDERKDIVVEGIPVAMVEMSGTFVGMMMPGAAGAEPASGTTMLAAIVQTKPRPHFFKLTGPTKTVDAAKADFQAFIESIKPAQ